MAKEEVGVKVLDDTGDEEVLGVEDEELGTEEEGVRDWEVCKADEDVELMDDVTDGLTKDEEERDAGVDAE